MLNKCAKFLCQRLATIELRWHIWPTFPSNFFIKFSQKMPLNLLYTMVQKRQKWPKTQIKGGGSCLKGSVERSLLPWAIFLIFTRNRPRKSEDHLRAVFYWNVKGKTRKKRKNTASFVASLGAGVQPRSTVQLFMPVSGVEKRPFSQFYLGFGVSFGEEKPSVTSNASF